MEKNKVGELERTKNLLLDEEKEEILDKDENENMPLKNRVENEYDIRAQKLKKYYKKYQVYLNTSKCLSLNFGTFKKYYTREYGYFCFSCFDREICEDCYFNCHKNCPEIHKKITKIKDTLKTRFICPCNGDTLHSQRKKYVNTCGIHKDFNTLGKLYNYLIPHEKEDKKEDEENEEKEEEVEFPHSLEDFENLKEITVVLEDKNKVPQFILSKYGIKDDIFEVYNKSFEALDQMIINFYDFYYIFKAFHVLILKNHFERNFGYIKSLSLNDFKYSSLLDLFWYKKYLIKKVSESERISKKYFRNDSSNIQNLKSPVIRNYIDSTIKFLDGMETRLDLEDYYNLLGVFCLNLNYLALYFLLDEESILVILEYAFKLTLKMPFDLKNLKIEEEPKFDPACSYYYPHQLCKLIYVCSKTYDYKIFEDYMNNGRTSKTFMFYNDGKYINEEGDFKSTAVITFLRLIIQNQNDASTREKGMKMLKSIFFTPYSQTTEILYSPLYFQYDFNKISLKNKNDYVNFCKQIYIKLNSYLIKLGEELDKELKQKEISEELDKELKQKEISEEPELIEIPQKEEEKKTVKISFSPFLQAEYDELLNEFNKLDDFINYEENVFKNKERRNFLYQFHSKTSDLIRFYDKNNEVIYENEFNDKAKDIVNHLIYASLDQAAANFISELFGSFLPLKKEDEEHLPEIEVLLNKCLNILNLMTLNETGLQALKIGKSLDFLADIILRNPNINVAKIEYMNKNEKYHNLFRKLYKFYSSLPIEIKRPFNIKIKKLIWSDNLIEILPIYLDVFEPNEALNSDETLYLLDNYYDFMQIHKEEFDFKKIVDYLINNYNTEENYKKIDLNDRDFELSQLYFQLLRLIACHHAFYTPYNFKPEQSLLHILSIDKCIELINLPKLPLKKKGILLESMLLIITSPFKSWKTFFGHGLYAQIMNQDAVDFIARIHEKYIFILKDELNKLNSSMFGNKEYREYYITILDMIKYFSNFLYTLNVVSSLLVRSYYILYLNLKSYDCLLQKLILNENMDVLNIDENYEDDEEFKILELNNPNRVCFYYNSLYEKFYNILKKYKDTLKSVTSDSLYYSFFDEKYRNIGYANLARYEFIFGTDSQKLDLPDKIKNDNNFSGLVEKTDKWRKFLLSKLKDNENYIFNKLFEVKYTQFLSFRYNINDNFALIIFCLLSISIDEGAIMILKNTDGIIGNLKVEDFLNIQKDKETYPTFLEILLNKILNRLNFAVFTNFSTLKLYANTKLENSMCKIHLSIIKLLQNLLENFNTTFAYFLFVKKYVSITPYSKFEKKFDFGFYEMEFEKNYFFIEKKSVQHRINEVLEKNLKNNFCIIPYTLENKYNIMKYFASVYSLGSLFGDSESEPRTFIIHLLNFFEICNDSISQRFVYFVSKSIVTPDFNLAILFNAVIDFYIECFSTFSLLVKKILYQAILPYSVMYTRFTSGFLGILNNCTEDLSPEYNDINLFVKVKLCDLAKIVFGSGYFPYYNFFRVNITDSVGEKANLENVGEDYYNMILFYLKTIYKRCEQNKKMNRLFFDLKQCKTPVKYSEKFLDIYLHNPEFSQNMEFELIFRTFTFINNLYYSYNFDWLAKHYEKLEKNKGYNENDLFNNNSLLSFGFYLFLQIMCPVIKFNFRVLDKYKEKIEKIEIFTDEKDNKNRLDKIYKKYQNDLMKSEKMEVEDQVKTAKTIQHYLAKEEEEKEEEEEKKEEEVKEKSQEEKKKEEEEKKQKEEKELNDLIDRATTKKNRMDEQLRLDNVLGIIKREQEKKNLFDTDDNYDREQLDLIDWYDGATQFIKGWSKVANDNKVLQAITKGNIHEVLPDEEKHLYFTRSIEEFFLSEETKNTILNSIDMSTHETKIKSLIKATEHSCFEILFKKAINFQGAEMEISKYESINMLSIILINILVMINLFLPATATTAQTVIQIIIYIFVAFMIVFCVYITSKYVKTYYVYYLFRDLNAKSKFSFLSTESNISGASTEDTPEKTERRKKILEVAESSKKNVIKMMLTIFEDLTFKDIVKSTISIFLDLSNSISYHVFTILLYIIYFITSSPICLVIPIVFCAHTLGPVKEIFSGVSNRWSKLLLSFLFNMVVFYVIGMLSVLISKTSSATNIATTTATNATIVAQANSTSIQGLLDSISGGLTGNTTSLITSLTQTAKDTFIGMFFCNIVFFLIMSMFFSNVYTGQIADAFGEARARSEKNENARQNECTICNISRGDCENRGENFEVHISKTHSSVNYFYFICYLYCKDPEDFNPSEKCIWSLIEEHDISWVPLYDPNANTN